MQILMTGSSIAQANALKKRIIQKIDVPLQIKGQLEALGHEVDWRPVGIGEGLGRYDLLWVYGAPPGSIQAPYGMCTSWGLYQALALNLPIVFFFDDWKIKNVFNDYRSLARGRAKQTLKIMPSTGRYLYRGDLVTAAEHADVLGDLAKQIGERDPAFWKRVTSVIPKYSGWGDKSLVETIMTFPVMEYDPSQTAFDVVGDTLVEHPTSDLLTDRMARWFLASLSIQTQWIDKLKLAWSVDMIGSTKLKNPRLKTERDVFLEYTKYAGALAPPYYHDGSGWFRSRYVYSAYAGNVLKCGPGDGAQLSSDHFIWDPRVIEAYSGQTLKALASAQRDVLLTKIQPPGDLSACQLEAILKDAEARA